MTQEYQYKAIVTLKFSIDDLFCETEQEAKNMLYDDPGKNVEWAEKHGSWEILDIQLENLGLNDKEAYYKAKHGKD